MSKQGYHHGDLRRALVEAALRLIEEKGPTGFTLSEAAKTAGVTPAAVYRHFAGREDLITECARQGFLIFGDLLEHAWNRGKPSALTAFNAVGRAYLAFATRYPGHYMAMFESGISPQTSDVVGQVALKARQVMDQATEALLAHIPIERRPPVAMVSAHIAAMSHGVIELHARPPAGSASPYSPEDLLESGVGIYLRGLGILPPDL